MRAPLAVDVVCRICGARYVHRNVVEVVGGRPQVTSKPTPCPRCDAPLRFGPTIDVGLAKGLLLLLTGVPHYRKAYGSLAQLFASSCHSVAQLDALLACVRGMDFDAWAEHAAQLAGSERQRRAQVRQAEEARAAAAGGPRWQRLMAAAEATRAALEEERARHLAILAAREGTG